MFFFCKFINIFQEKQYRTKNPEYVAEDLAFQTDISLNLLCKKHEYLKPFVLDKTLSLDSGKCKKLDLLLPEILNKVWIVKKEVKLLFRVKKYLYSVNLLQFWTF